MGKLATTFAASLGARILTALSGIVAMPIYLRLLGPNDFGIVGFFLSLQLIVNFLDLGLGTTLVRQLSIHYKQFPTLAHRYARTYEASYAVLALFALTVLMSLASWLAYQWLETQANQRAELPAQLRWASLAICLTWMSGIYSCILMGLEQQSKLAGVQCLSVVFRFILPVVAVHWYADLTTFFIAQVIASIGHWLIFRFTALRMLPQRQVSTSKKSSIDWMLIRSDAKFSAGMFGIYVTTFLITQLDKVILSKTINLEDFGLYTLCVTFAGGIYLAVQPLFNLLYPRFSRLLDTGSESDIKLLYRLGAQLMALMVIPISAVIIIFAPQVLWVWTNDLRVAQRGADVLRLLTLANAINSVMNLPYAIQLAHGWVSLPLKVNYLAVAFLMPAMVWSVNHWGIVGIAYVIFTIHAATLLVVPYITHKRLLSQENGYWFKYAVVIPAMTCAVVVSIINTAWPTGNERWQDLFVMLTALMVTLLATLMVLPDLRQRGVVFLQSFEKNL